MNRYWDKIQNLGEHTQLRKTPRLFPKLTPFSDDIYANFENACGVAELKQHLESMRKNAYDAIVERDTAQQQADELAKALEEIASPVEYDEHNYGSASVARVALAAYRKVNQ